MKRKIFSTGFLFLLSLFFLFVGKAALADYPETKIRMVVAWPPGGGTDVMGRTVVHYVNPYLRDKIYVDNVPGAGGAIGAREVAKAAPDGYTLLILTTSSVIGPNIQKDYPPYELFDPICIVQLDAQVMTVKEDSRFKTLGDLISYAKLHPGEVTITTAGVGAVDHLTVEAFMSATGTKLTLVPHKGSAQNVMAVLGGHVEAGMSGFSETFSLIEGKKLRPLVHFGNKRSSYFPDVPTAKELGYNVVTVMFRGVAARKGTSEEIKKVLGEAFRKGTQNEEFKKTLAKERMEPIYIGPTEAITWVKEMGDFFKGVTVKIGLKPE